MLFAISTNFFLSALGVTVLFNGRAIRNFHMKFVVSFNNRYRGSIHVYDFLEDLTTQDVPEICLSTYDQPGASKYNIALAMPYDVLTY